MDLPMLSKKKRNGLVDSDLRPASSSLPPILLVVASLELVEPPLFVLMSIYIRALLISYFQYVKSRLKGQYSSSNL
jgi:hypothetical protein